MNLLRTISIIALWGTAVSWPIASHSEDKPRPAAGSEATHVQAAEAARLVEESKVTVLDIRTPGEYQGGHIKGAVNIDFNAADFEAKLRELDRSKPYLVHCQGGGRSGRSLKTFVKLGFAKIYHLDGGVSAWEDAGKPLEK